MPEKDYTPLMSGKTSVTSSIQKSESKKVNPYANKYKKKLTVSKKKEVLPPSLPKIDQKMGYLE
jgi:hypothetical protein